MTLMDVGGKAPIGGVKSETLMTCPKCDRSVVIPPGLALRIPGKAKGYCHETVNLRTGIVYRRG